MRFIHIADTHLGMTPDKGTDWSEARKNELMNSFSDLISICRTENTELLLIAGDLFHQQPLVRELKEVSSLFASIPNTRIVLIAGNHDYISGMSHYNSFEWPDNVTFLADESIQSIYFEDINTEVYGLSYHHRELHDGLYDSVRPTDPTRINILLAHGGDLTHIPINQKSLATSGFDYVALGHIHKPAELTERIRFCGSLEPLDKNETGAHGYIIGTLTKTVTDAPAELNASFVTHAVREYFSCTIDIDRAVTSVVLRDKLRSLIETHGQNNIYVITIRGRRDPDIAFDPTAYSDLGNILEFNDLTEPDYDFDSLKVENRDNIIGMYIDRIAVQGSDPEITRKALYYGVSALLKRQ